MQSLPGPRLGDGVAWTGALLVALAVAGALSLTLAGDWPHGATRHVAVRPPQAVAPTFDGVLAGAPLQRASCANWKAASPAARAGAVGALRGLVGGASTTGGVGTTLTDAQAFRLFDTHCATAATQGFLLYVIYARAAAFR